MKLPLRQSPLAALQRKGPGVQDSSSPIPKGQEAPAPDCLGQLIDLVRSRRRLLVLTGAGCSTESGIPDYRDETGHWKSRQPMTYRSFVSSWSARQRYWARSFHGWRRIEEATPNPAHTALARLESQGRMLHLVTQNVDSLHQKAGSRNITDLHGRLATVKCLRCSYRSERRHFQKRLMELNPGWETQVSLPAPDGDAQLTGSTEDFLIPDCPSCGGVLKPAVVFFGEGVPRNRVRLTNQLLDESDGLLVVGSSLMVWSGYRFTRAAALKGVPVMAINLGVTRADDILELKVELPCGAALPALLAGLER